MSKQKFKGKTLYTKTSVRNIIKIYELCEAPTQWYQDANLYAAKLAQEYNYTTAQICGVIAAFSPLKSWTENKVITELYLKSGKCKHTKTMKNKAAAILKTTDIEEIAVILNGNKITSFFLNMLQPNNTEAVTIDRHAIAIILGRPIKENEGNFTDKQYLFFVNCYKIAAKKLDIVPSLLQSATWEKWRELKKEENFLEVPF